MKKAAKLTALIVGVGGAIGLGYLISVISSSISDSLTCILLIVITLFLGGALILGISIYLFLYANDDLKPKPTTDIIVQDSPSQENDEISELQDS